MLYSGNWAEEIDVDGFVIMEKEYVSYMKKFLKDFNYTISVDIGFNEEVEYDNGRELLGEIEFIKITNKDSEIIKKIFGVENLLENAKLLDKSNNGNELYLLEGLFRQPAYYLKYSCPSTGRVYVKGVDPRFAKEHKNADECQAHSFSWSLQEYLQLEKQS